MVKVMIVENSSKPWVSMKMLLSSINYDIVYQTSNGYEAIEKFKVTNPDILLLDLVLSKGDGKSVLQEIKKNYPQSKIIIITLQSDKNLIDECYNLGAEACFTIPYKMKDFVNFITKLSDSSKATSEIAPIIFD